MLTSLYQTFYFLLSSQVQASSHGTKQPKRMKALDAPDSKIRTSEPVAKETTTQILPPSSSEIISGGACLYRHAYRTTLCVCVCACARGCAYVCVSINSFQFTYTTNLVFPGMTFNAWWWTSRSSGVSSGEIKGSPRLCLLTSFRSLLRSAVQCKCSEYDLWEQCVLTHPPTLHENMSARVWKHQVLSSLNV